MSLRTFRAHSFDFIKDVDLILSAGDLKAEYLSFLVTMVGKPVFYVCGNHDGSYEKRPPEGCDCIDGKIVSYNGVRILGLGGSMYYNGGPYQYSEERMLHFIDRKVSSQISGSRSCT